jgi:hypothetical protein
MPVFQEALELRWSSSWHQLCKKAYRTASVKQSKTTFSFFPSGRVHHLPARVQRGHPCLHFGEPLFLRLKRQLPVYPKVTLAEEPISLLQFFDYWKALGYLVHWMYLCTIPDQKRVVTSDHLKFSVTKFTHNCMYVLDNISFQKRTFHCIKHKSSIKCIMQIW